jgi:site-specific recombinase XerD
MFGELLDAFVPWAFGRGYKIHTVYQQLDAVRHLAAWFRRKGRQSADAFSMEDLAAGRRRIRLRPCGPRYACSLRAFFAFLQTLGLVKPVPPKPPTPSERELACFLEYLRRDRGAAPGTCVSYQRHAGQFLAFLGLDRHPAALRNLTLADVHRFVCRRAGQYQRQTIAHVVTNLRGFLRFQFMQGVLRSPLHLQLDTMRACHEAPLPSPVEWSEVQQVLRRMDRATPIGVRDYAALQLAATYGLRVSDVTKLSLDAVNWRQRTIQIVQSKTGHPLVLPLTNAVGSALANYLRRARPNCAAREIFLREPAPTGPLSVSGMSQILGRASRAAGVVLKTAGFRCLRHALAMRLVRQGTSIKGIGDLLGHRSTQSTGAYLRFDIEDLRSVALPVPPASGPSKPKLVVGAAPVSSPRVTGRTAPRRWGWRSCLGEAMRDYVATQRALGREYKLEERTLRSLDYFLVSHYPHARRLTARSFAAWAMGLRPLCTTTARMRMCCVRKFCCHLARFRSGVFIPDLRTFPQEIPHQAPYLLSPTEMARVLAATTMIRATRSNPLHPQTIRLGFLLIYCCGLRKSEVLKLRLADIDTRKMVLRINEGKFRKSRLVPMSSSVADELRRYLAQRRRKHLPMEPEAPLIWNGWPRRNGRASALSSWPFWATWQRVCRAAQVLQHQGRPPRLHDLRHSFAMEVLRRSYRRGQNAPAVLPRLARYMGHAGVQFTHYYLKFTEPLRCAASDRFRHHFAKAVLPPMPPAKGGEA